MIMRSIIGKLRGLHREEGGQAIIFAALVFVVLVCFVALVVDVGEAVSWRIQMQSAVDAAALACGTTQARGLNMLQMMNDVHWGLRAANYATCLALAASDWCGWIP